MRRCGQRKPSWRGLGDRHVVSISSTRRVHAHRLSLAQDAPQELIVLKSRRSLANCPGVMRCAAWRKCCALGAPTMEATICRASGVSAPTRSPSSAHCAAEGVSSGAPSRAATHRHTSAHTVTRAEQVASASAAAGGGAGDTTRRQWGAPVIMARTSACASCRAPSAAPPPPPPMSAPPPPTASRAAACASARSSRS
jgi:hypothetical protein